MHRLFLIITIGNRWQHTQIPAKAGIFFGGEHRRAILQSLNPQTKSKHFICPQLKAKIQLLSIEKRGRIE